MGPESLHSNLGENRISDSHGVPGTNLGRHDTIAGIECRGDLGRELGTEDLAPGLRSENLLQFVIYWNGVHSCARTSSSDRNRPMENPAWPPDGRYQLLRRARALKALRCGRVICPIAIMPARS